MSQSTSIREHGLGDLKTHSLIIKNVHFGSSVESKVLSVRDPCQSAGVVLAFARAFITVTVCGHMCAYISFVNFCCLFSHVHKLHICSVFNA